MKNIFKLTLVAFLFFVANLNLLYADIIKKVEVVGNDLVLLIDL